MERADQAVPRRRKFKLLVIFIGSVASITTWPLYETNYKLRHAVSFRVFHSSSNFLFHRVYSIDVSSELPAGNLLRKLTCCTQDSRMFRSSSLRNSFSDTLFPPILPLPRPMRFSTISRVFETRQPWPNRRNSN